MIFFDSALLVLVRYPPPTKKILRPEIDTSARLPALHWCTCWYYKKLIFYCCIDSAARSVLVRVCGVGLRFYLENLAQLSSAHSDPIQLNCFQENGKQIVFFLSCYSYIFHQCCYPSKYRTVVGLLYLYRMGASWNNIITLFKEASLIERNVNWGPAERVTHRNCIYKATTI